MARRKDIMLFASLLTVLYAAGACAQPAKSIENGGSPPKVEMGIAVTPRNFPAHTAQNVDQAFQIAKALADYAVFIYQWHELNINVARIMKAGVQTTLP